MALGSLALGLSPVGAAAREFALPATDVVASAEAFGASHPRPTVDLSVPAWWEFEPLGAADRVCVDVSLQSTRVAPAFRSGEMVLGGSIPRIRAGVRTKLWWKPDDRPPQPIPEEAFFSGSVEFPAAGRWIVVATSRDNWGCFVFEVPGG